MNYENYVIEKDDSLVWLLRCSVIPSKWKITKLILFLACSAHSLISIMALIVFLAKFSLEFFTKYAAMYFGFVHSIGVMIIAIKYLPQIYVVIKRINVTGRRLDALYIETHRKIRLLSKVANFFSVFLMLFAIAESLLFVPIFGAKPDLYIFNYLIDEYFLNRFKYSYYLKFIHYLSIPFLFGIAIAQILPVIYIILQIVYQTLNLNTMIANISSDYDLNNLHLYYDNTFQNVIKKRLLFCIKYHQDIKRIADDFQKLVQFPVLCQSVTSMVLGVSILFFVYFTMTPETHVRVILLSILVLVTIIVISITGQKLIDTTGLIFDTACLCDWFMWNNNNRRILKIFLMNCLTPYSLSMSKTVTLDYSFFVSVITNLCSMATVLGRFKAMQNL